MLRHATSLALLLIAASCGPPNSATPCTGDPDCNLRPGGRCMPSPLGSDQCAYPDGECPGGYSWSELSGSISGMCVADVDAGIDAIDAPIDATDAPIDAPIEPPPDGGITTGMIQIPAGSFWRGCNPANPNPYACNSLQLQKETPYREITLAEFWIDKYEVTQERFAACVTANGCTVPAPVDPSLAVDAGYDPANKPDHPVSNVTWAQARAFCMWLGRRLPTEAEWEKAARGGDGRMYPWGDTPEPAADCMFANVALCPGSGTHAVGSHPAGDSVYGVSDMAGNVEEFVNDFYDVTYYASAPATNPQGPLSGNARVVRGAAYPHSNTGARVANRSTSGASAPEFYARGFRCAYSP